MQDPKKMAWPDIAVDNAAALSANQTAYCIEEACDLCIDLC